MAEADVLRGRERRDLARGRSALGDDRDGAGDQPHRHEARPGRRPVEDVEKPEAVRAEEGDAEPATQLDQPLLRAGAVAADLAEPRSEHDGVPDSRGRDVRECALDPTGAHEDDRKVELLADLHAARGRRTAVHNAAVAVHEVQAAVESELLEVVERSLRPAGPIRRTDDRDAPRREQAPELVEGRRPR